MFYTYTLVSKSGQKTYTGVTANLERRLKEHNNGKVSFSRKFKPYEILLCEKYSTIQEALSREKFYKSTTGRRQLKIKFNEWRARTCPYFFLEEQVRGFSDKKPKVFCRRGGRAVECARLEGVWLS